jgi:TRAP-type uncharacterized transport system fused permease subunit
MTQQPPDDDFIRLWQEQTDGGTKMAEIRLKAARLESVVRRRNLLEFAAAAVVVVAFTRIIWNSPSVLARVGAALILLATAYVVYRLHRHGSTLVMPEELALTSCVDFHRAQLLRQRDLLRSVWRWYLLPFVPGLFLLLLSQAAADPGRAARAAIISGLVFLGIGWLNERAARRIDGDIESLDAVR